MSNEAILPGERSGSGGMMNGSFHVVTIAEIPIRIHNLFPLFIGVSAILGFIPPATVEQGLLK